MPVTTGQKAPDFTVYTTDAQEWTLSEHLDRPLVVLFFPGAFSGVCTDELSFVSNNLDDYRALGARVIGISTDSVPVLAEFARARHILFPLASDHNAEAAAAYGAKYDGDFTHMNLDRIAKRSAFVIDTDRSIVYAEILDNAERQPDFDAVQDALRTLG
jgi:glutaredoxin-dependent peroxiredoxin